MKQIQLEEIFAWFQGMSGAKRIELMCGLISMCIPLEKRFFETILQDAVKRDYNSLRDAEIKANSAKDLENVCKCDLWAENMNVDQYYEDNTDNLNNGAINNTNALSNNNSTNNTNTNTNNNSTNNNSATANTNSSNNENTTAPSSTPTLTNNNNGNKSQDMANANLTCYPTRSKLIISLCLMQPNNISCSKVVFDYIRKQLIAPNIYKHFDLYMNNNNNIDQLFSELLLLLTMAIYHPAFTYEQRDLLTAQKKDLEHVYFHVMSYFLRSPHIIAQVPLQIVASTQQVSTAAAGSVAQTSTTSGPASAVVISSSSSGQPQSSTVYHQTPTNPSGQPQAAQSHHAQPQYHHSYHPTGNKSLHQNPGPHLTAVAQTPYSLPFIPNAMPIANIAYTNPGQGTISNISNQQNAVIQNMALLKIQNSPQQSPSQSPSISPSSGTSSCKTPTSTTAVAGSSVASNINTGHPFSIKLDPMFPGQPNSLITIVDNNVQPLCIGTLMVDDTNKNVSSSTSCYNCGNMGHRGTECTTIGTPGDDNH